MRALFKKLLGPLWSRAGLVAGCVMTALAGVMCFLPLSNILGYEASAVTGLLVPLVAAVVWFGPLSGQPWLEGVGGDLSTTRPWRVWWRMTAIGLLLLVPGWAPQIQGRAEWTVHRRVSRSRKRQAVP